MGIGILLTTFIMTGVKINYNLSKSQIEQKARQMGMNYPTEFKVINEKGVSK